MDLGADLVTLLRAITDVESVSGRERRLADQVEAALREQEHLDVTRNGDAVIARTRLGRATRVVIAGHLDTVPVAGNLPSYVDVVAGEPRVYGRGTCDMKGGLAVMLKAAAELRAPGHDVTWIFYDNEEVSGSYNGLGRIAGEQPELLEGEFAVLCEPSGAQIEGGCQGTMRLVITTRGVAAHSARSWLGHNAIHDMSDVLERLQRFNAREIEVDGLVYREGLNAVRIGGGVAGNVVPDACWVEINYRFAPDKSTADAVAVMEDVFDGYRFEVTDLQPGARPGLDQPAAKAFVDSVPGAPRAKYGWTDVARFSALGIPAVNYGPGDPGKAHADDEYCPVEHLELCFAGITGWLKEAQ